MAAGDLPEKRDAIDASPAGLPRVQRAKCPNGYSAEDEVFSLVCCVRFCWRFISRVSLHWALLALPPPMLPIPLPPPPRATACARTGFAAPACCPSHLLMTMFVACAIGQVGGTGGGLQSVSVLVWRAQVAHYRFIGLFSPRRVLQHIPGQRQVEGASLCAGCHFRAGFSPDWQGQDQDRRQQDQFESRHDGSRFGGFTLLLRGAGYILGVQDDLDLSLGWQSVSMRVSVCLPEGSPLK